MIKIQNQTTGQIVKVSNVVLNEGMMVARPDLPHKSARFYNNYPMLKFAGYTMEANKRDIFEFSEEGWIILSSERTKQAAVETPEVETIENACQSEPVVSEPVVEGMSEELREEELTIAKEGLCVMNEYGRENVRKELLAKYGVMGAEIFEAAAKYADNGGIEEASLTAKLLSEIQHQVALKFDEFKKEQSSAAPRKLEVVSPQGTFTVNGKTCKNFAIYCNLVQAGKPLYMYGPAGSGKSYTAKQIAEALGFDYYETSQAMFAHELKGYGDAKGDFVETAFYRAFVNGGVFFLDEVDASAPEALVVLNNAIANKRFDFPVIGNCVAHENFRVVAAGNTRMTGATIEYTARQMQDTSFKNRFFFEVVTYDRDVMLDITGGDEEIVNFGADLRRAARETGISQLFSYRQAEDLATLQGACLNDDSHLLRGSVLQEKEVDDVQNLYAHLSDKRNRWARAMKNCIEEMKNEEVW